MFKKSHELEDEIRKELGWFGVKYEWEKCRIGDLCNTISDTYKGNDHYVVLVNTSDVLEGKILNHIKVENKT